MMIGEKTTKATPWAIPADHYNEYIDNGEDEEIERARCHSAKMMGEMMVACKMCFRVHNREVSPDEETDITLFTYHGMRKYGITDDVFKFTENAAAHKNEMPKKPLKWPATLGAIDKAIKA